MATNISLFPGSFRLPLHTSPNSPAKTPKESLVATLHALYKTSCFTVFNVSVCNLSITCTNDLFNLHTGYINLLGKLPHSLVGVLICERININLHSWSHLEKRKEPLQYLIHMVMLILLQDWQSNAFEHINRSDHLARSQTFYGNYAISCLTFSKWRLNDGGGFVVTNGGYDSCLMAILHSYPSSKDIAPRVLSKVIRWVNIYISSCVLLKLRRKTWSLCQHRSALLHDINWLS